MELPGRDSENSPSLVGLFSKSLCQVQKNSITKNPRRGFLPGEPRGTAAHSVAGSVASALQASRFCPTRWWLNQPIWKICSSNWVHLPQIGVKINKNMKPPPSPVFMSHGLFCWEDSSCSIQKPLNPLAGPLLRIQKHSCYTYRKKGSLCKLEGPITDCLGHQEEKKKGKRKAFHLMMDWSNRPKSYTFGILNAQRGWRIFERNATWTHKRSMGAGIYNVNMMIHCVECFLICIGRYIYIPTAWILWIKTRDEGGSKLYDTTFQQFELWWLEGVNIWINFNYG